MSLNSFAQELIISDKDSDTLIPLEVIEVVSDGLSDDNLVITDNAKEHSHEHHEHHEHDGDLHEFHIFVEDLPGAPPGTKDPEPEPEEALEVEDESEKDENDAQKIKKEKWDWESKWKSKGPSGFFVWVKDMLAAVPKHSGYDSAGIERAIAFLDRLDSEISKAMRMDLDSELDANKIEEVRSKIDDGIDALQQRLNKIKKTKKSKKKKADVDSELIKEAQKAVGIQGTFVVVPLLISRLGRIIINGTVSAGHDAEEMFNKLCTKYKLTDREQAELLQYLADSNFPMLGDRGYKLDEDYSLRSSDNFDYSAIYSS